MSGGRLSVVTQFPKRLNPFSSLKTDNLSLSSAADSPENREDIAVGVVTVPGVDKDFHIKDIPIVTGDNDGRSADMVQQYMKPATPSDNIVPPSYLTSACSSPDTVSSLETATDPPISCQPNTSLDHMYMSLTKGTESNGVMAENAHLREMLVSQLDLIQQQSETIMSKDKQLRQLRDENSLLLSRLSRMERRCRGDPDPAGSSSTERKGTPVSQSGTKRSRDIDSTPDNQLKKKKVESKASLEPNISVGKEPIEAFGPCDDELTDEFMSDLLSVGSRPDTPLSIASVDTATSDTAQKPSKKVKKQSADSKRKSAGPPAAAESSGEKSKKSKLAVPSSDQAKPVIPSIPPHETEYLYFVGCKNDLLPNVDDHLEVTSLQRGVEVPCYREDADHYTSVVPNKLCIKKNKEASWRIKNTNLVYNPVEAPGEEDTRDQSFLKRHDKFEKEEKQRKRWDLQRLREEQQLQKLRARQEKQILPGHSVKKDDTSLLPFIETATHVSVGERIPVSAFGRPIPTLPHNSFSLPWVGKSRHSL